MQQFLMAAWRNKNTSGSALALFAAKAGGIMWPAYKDRLDQIADLAIVYGLINAGDQTVSGLKMTETETEKKL